MVSKPDQEPLPLRPNVCMVLVSRDGRLFLGERAGQPNVWQFPQGGANAKYSLRENVLRELEEELGLPAEKVEIVKQLKVTHDYEWDSPPDYAVNRWRGQTQTFWIVQFLGVDSDICLDLHEPELMDWRWCTVSEMKEIAEPKRLPGYLKALPEIEEFLETL